MECYIIEYNSRYFSLKIVPFLIVMSLSYEQSQMPITINFRTPYLSSK